MERRSSSASFSRRTHADIERGARSFDAAEANFREAIAALRSAPAPDELAIADITNDLAVLLKNKGELAAAEPLYREVLALRRGTTARHIPSSRSRWATSPCFCASRVRRPRPNR